MSDHFDEKRVKVMAQRIGVIREALMARNEWHRGGFRGTALENGLGLFLTMTAAAVLEVSDESLLTKYLNALHVLLDQQLGQTSQRRSLRVANEVLRAVGDGYDEIMKPLDQMEPPI